jgi:poly-beta-1,6-N-acetyl-D-glucosamine synthase
MTAASGKRWLNYGIVTPVRDEEHNLRRLADSMLRQTREPAVWVIVDNGSTDGTGLLAESLARRHDWIVHATSEPTERAEPGAPIVRAFLAGLELITDSVDVLVKLDADVSFDSDHFERLLDAFASNPRLGIAGSTCLEVREGRWRAVTTAAHHVRGAVRAYRRECLNAVGPLEPVLGWDSADELKASALGWQTETLPDVAFRHHRPLGARDGRRWTRARRQGTASHYLGYRFWYLALRGLRRSLDDPASVAMIWGFLEAAAKRTPKHPDPAVRREARRRQSLSQLPARVGEAVRDRRRSVEGVHSYPPNR